MLAHGLCKTYNLNRERYNYEVRAILWQIKQIMQHVLKMQYISLLPIHKMNF